MSQQHQDQRFNEGRTPQDIAREVDQSHYEDEAIAEEQLGNEELTDVSGGANEDRHLSAQEVSYRVVGPGTNPLEPGPTFPTPPSEDVL